MAHSVVQGRDAMRETPVFVARQPGSADNLGPFLNVITWILLITSALAVLTRLVTKRALRRRIDVDDGFAVAALVTSIGSGVSVSVQTANGLGRSIALLTQNQFVAYEKVANWTTQSEYANKLLYIATLAFAKLSIISLLMILTASELHRRMGIALTTFIAAWGVVSEFVAAFQCGKNRPWHSFGPDSNCHDTPAFWLGMSIINMLTDLALILFPIHIIVTLQMSTGKKFAILTFFGARILDIIATGIQIAYVSSFSSLDPTLDLWKWTLTTQVVECITILTSCVPYLRPLLESIPSGLYGADHIRRRTICSSSPSRSKSNASYKLSSIMSTTEEKRNRKSQCENGMKRFRPMFSAQSTTHSNSASGLPGGPRRPDGEIDVEISASGPREEKRWDTDSTGSQAKIVKTTVVVVMKHRFQLTFQRRLKLGQ
ncbi:hypothetical protein CC78DRAFT_540516 [Lojkania enalia]|uniref:Rhodopsin domain-containing protein n=1 Tax=Lojkania enalia TaxID=147567 RepID=A0A9P4KI23_9PLEO|nr:hypothetical protein CC78DRAFT_540516 [Didymosphaeria enalia]